MLIEAGVDEAGRGPLAGNLFAAAVILPKDFEHHFLDDSKKMSEKRRYELREIIERDAIAWCVAEATIEEIDQINILNATFLCMNRAVEGLSIPAEMLLIDGNRFKTNLSTPYECMIKGDGRFANIAAASVLAKTYRDDYMERIGEEFPQYNWSKNKGYGTKVHMEAIREYGLSPYHRHTFCKKFL